MEQFGDLCSVEVGGLGGLGHRTLSVSACRPYGGQLYAVRKWSASRVVRRPGEPLCSHLQDCRDNNGECVGPGGRRVLSHVLRRGGRAGTAGVVPSSFISTSGEGVASTSPALWLPLCAGVARTEVPDGGPLDPGGRLDLGHRPSLAAGGLPGALPQPANDQHPVALAQRLTQVGGLVP